jgi:hypothetical protein
MQTTFKIGGSYLKITNGALIFGFFDLLPDVAKDETDVGDSVVHQSNLIGHGSALRDRVLDAPNEFTASSESHFETAGAPWVSHIFSAARRSASCIAVNVKLSAITRRSGSLISWLFFFPPR